MSSPSSERSRLSQPSVPAVGRTAVFAVGLRASVIALISASGLAYEIALTRVFSLYFQYHYVFLVLSLAVLGISLGAAGGQFLRQREEPTQATLGKALFALCLSYPIVAIVIGLLPSAMVAIGCFVLTPIPFILVGFCSTLLFAQARDESGTLYAADLIGAAAGVLGVLALLNVFDAFSIVILLGALNALGLLLMSLKGSNGMRNSAAILLVGLIGLSLVNAITGFANYNPLHISQAPPDKTLIQVLQDSAMQARVVYSTWNPFARIDVVETADPTQKLVFTDGGAGSYMLRFDGNLGSMQEQRVSVEFLPFLVSTPNKTLVLGAGAGKDVLLALLAGSKDITAVEVNPAMIATTRKYADYNGNIFDRPEVRLHVGDARTFTEASREQFDLVYLNVVYSQAAPPASQALVENYIFTAEAFRAYLNRLAPNGKLALVLHNGLEGTRAAITAIKALQDMGVPPAQAIDQMALLMRNGDDPGQRVTVLVISQARLTADEISLLQRAAQALDLQAMHLPSVFEDGFRNLKTGMSLERFVALDQTYDLFPTTDQRPFFYKLDPPVPTPISTALGFAVTLGVIILLLALGQKSEIVSPMLLLYMALIGSGFMLIEIPLIQQLSLLIGYPTLAIALVLGTLLVSGGIGSGYSQRWPPDQLPRRVRLAAIIIVGLGVLYWLALPTLSTILIRLPFIVRVLAVVILVTCVGLPMGVPFASALRLSRSSQGVGWLWAVNGAFSVIGSTVVMFLAMQVGFQWAMVLGIAAYALLIVLTLKLSNVRAYG